MHQVNRPLLCLLGLATFWLLSPKSADGHGLPIYVSINPSTNQVEVSGSFDYAVVDGFFTSDLPGIGVLNTFSGVSPDSTISLRFSQDLLYTNSDELESTSSEVTVVSAEFVQQMTIHNSSGLQEFLDWAVYPPGAGIGWDADGLYFLGPGTPDQGVYGVVAQIVIEGAIDSEPFLSLLFTTRQTLTWPSTSFRRQSSHHPKPTSRAIGASTPKISHVGQPTLGTRLSQIPQRYLVMPTTMES